MKQPSTADAFAGVVLVSCHGGNAEPLRAAVTTLTCEGRQVMAWVPDGDRFGGEAGLDCTDRSRTRCMLSARLGSLKGHYPGKSGSSSKGAHANNPRGREPLRNIGPLS